MPANIQPTRFVGIDLHKHYAMLGAVDAQQKVVLPPHRLALQDFEVWMAQYLRATDAVVLEATTNAWFFYDLLAPRAASVTVAHPLMVKWITAARVKTDPRDTIHLARLLAAGLIPAVWVPPPAVRELRALIAHRRRLVNWRTQARNRLHSALHRHNLTPPEGSPFAASQRAWWQSLPLPASEKLRVRHDLALLDSLEPFLTEVESELLRLSTVEPWVPQVPFLVQVPGIGILNALVVVSAIGEITRFPTAKQLVGYSGLGASVHDSGQTHRGGGITKQGRREIRAAMVEAAWRAVEHHPHWKAEFERLQKRLPKQKAIVAIARKLLVVIWHVLTHHAADCHAEPEAVARKFMNWGTEHRTATRAGLSRRAFVRKQLDQVGVGAELKRFQYGGQSHELPPSTVGRSPG